MNTSRETEAIRDAKNIAAGNLILAARMNERQARSLAKDGTEGGEECRKICLRLARIQRAIVRKGRE